MQGKTEPAAGSGWVPSPMSMVDSEGFPTADKKVGKARMMIQVMNDDHVAITLYLRVHIRMPRISRTHCCSFEENSLQVVIFH